ncbi:MAG: hypothetical protein ABIG66_02305 [Candidatus Kerfeldbacteria bacterium]
MSLSNPNFVVLSILAIAVIGRFAPAGTPLVEKAVDHVRDALADLVDSIRMQFVKTPVMGAYAPMMVSDGDTVDTDQFVRGLNG